MSTQIRDTAELDTLPEGTIVVVAVTGDGIREWTKVESGLQLEGVIIPATQFANAVRNGRCYLRGAHHVGDTVYSATTGEFCRAVGYDHEPGQDASLIWAVTDSNGLWKHITSTEPVGEAYSVGATTSAVLDLGGNWWKAGLRNEILEIAIDNGELPTEHEMTVTVEASGTVEVAPTADQVAGLIGDSVKPGDITDVAVSEVTWTKRVEVRKEVLGHCACNHVTVEDLDALTPGAVTSWRVITCA